MESNWGRNVQDLGLGDIGAQLCASYLPFPRLIVTNANHIWETGIGLGVTLPDTADGEYVFSTVGGTPHTNFPYGLPVEPFVRV